MENIENIIINYPVVSLLIIIVVLLIVVYALIQGKKITLFGFIKIGGKGKKVSKPSEPDQETNLSNSKDINFHLGSISNSYFYIRREDYYKKYFECVSNAKDSVHMIGDGFACHKEDNNCYAIGLINAIESALKNGAIVRRFQYNTTLSLKWLNYLRKLKNDYPEKFFLYMHTEYDPVVLPYAIVLVDENKENASINVMFTSLSDTSLEEKTAGPAFIFEKEDKIAELQKQMSGCLNDFFKPEYSIPHPKLKEKYDNLRKQRIKRIREYFIENNTIAVDKTSLRQTAKKLDILDVDLVLEVAFDELSKQEQLYFAYGSNLLDERIQHQDRCPSAEFATTGYIKNYEMIFNILGNKAEGKNGGVANIIESTGKTVHGALYKIDKDELIRLNELEASMNYEVLKVKIKTKFHGEVAAIVYMNKVNPVTDIYSPTPTYKKYIEDGMKVRKFNEEYQKEINNKMN